MGSRNLKLRGGTYYWRRKITVARTAVSMSFPLATGSYSRARSIADRLGAAAETLRMSYGEQTGMSPEKLRRVFSDAMRWQLGRILEDQAGSAAPSADHAITNSLHAVAWEFLARNGPDARWTPDDHERLVELGWSPDKAMSVAQFLFDNQDGSHLSRGQIDTYLQAFATSMLKGRVPDSVRCDLFGHEGETETERTYDEEADLSVKLDALRLLSPVTEHILPAFPVTIRSPERLRHGTPRGRRR